MWKFTSAKPFTCTQVLFLYPLKLMLFITPVTVIHSATVCATVLEPFTEVVFLVFVLDTIMPVKALIFVLKLLDVMRKKTKGT